MVSWKTSLAGVAVVTLSLVGAESMAAQSPPACSDEKSHQFDFWIGEWEVYAEEQLAGHNTIEPLLDGCVLQESWQGASGSAGTSLNFYNPQSGRWQQFWVWRNGTTLELEGDFADGRMTLTGESLDQDGNEIFNRITWHDNPDGTVRQHWEISKDSGQTWATAFDGHYRQRK